MPELKANTEVKVRIGSFVDAADGVTPETGVTLGAADQAEVLKHGSDTVVDISGATWAAVTNCDGWYVLTLTASLTDTEGQLDVIVQDSSVCLPVVRSFMVLSQAAYDSKYAAKDSGYMDVNVKAVSEDTTAADDLELFIEALGTDDKALISTDAQDLSGTLDVNTKTITAGIIDATATGITNWASLSIDASGRVDVGVWNGTDLDTTNPLPNAAPDAAGGLPISDAGGLDLDAVLDAAVSSRSSHSAADAAAAVSARIGIAYCTVNATGSTTSKVRIGTMTPEYRKNTGVEIEAFRGSIVQFLDGDLAGEYGRIWDVFSTGDYWDLFIVEELSGIPASGVHCVIVPFAPMPDYFDSFNVDSAGSVVLADDSITSAKFDESTAFPLKSADTGSTQLARVGAGGDTLETISDQLDGVSTFDASSDTVDVGKINGKTRPAEVLAAQLYGYADDAVFVPADNDGTDADRFAKLDAAYTSAGSATPGGNALSTTNRACVLIPPGRYDVGAATWAVDTDYVDLIALVPEKGGDRKEFDADKDGSITYGTTDLGECRPSRTEIYCDDAGVDTVTQSASDVRMKGFSITHLSDSTDAAAALYVSATDNSACRYEQIYLWTRVCNSTVMPTRFALHVDGVWRECIANGYAWRCPNDDANAAQFKATMIDCQAGSFSYAGDYAQDREGTHKMARCRMIRCKSIGGHNGGSSGYASFAGCGVWAMDIDSDCYFEDCEALGGRSFGLGADCDGTFVRCHAGDYSFGSTLNYLMPGDFGGKAYDCIGGANSFGGTNVSGYGTLSGQLHRCIATGSSKSWRVNSGAIIDGCLLEVSGANEHCLTIIADTDVPVITNSTLLVEVADDGASTGVPIYAAEAQKVVAAGNRYNNTANDADGLGANVTNLGTFAELNELGAIYAKLPSKAYLAGTANADGDVEADEMTGSLSTTVTDINAAALAKFLTTDTGESEAVAGSVGKIAQGSAGLTASEIADAVFDEALADHTTEDTFGNVLNDLTEESSGTYRFTEAALAEAPTNTSITVSSTTVGEAPIVNFSKRQYESFGTETITAESSQDGDSHTLVAYTPDDPDTAVFRLTTAGGDISASGTTITISADDTYMTTARVLKYVLFNTTDDTVVSRGSIHVHANPDVS